MAALLVLLLLFLLGLGGLAPVVQHSSSSSKSRVATVSVARRVGLADSGSTLTLARGDEVDVSLPARWVWTRAVTTGTAVDVYGLTSGQWSLVAAKRGTFTFRTSGRPGGKPFVLTIRVR